MSLRVGDCVQRRGLRGVVIDLGRRGIRVCRTDTPGLVVQWWPEAETRPRAMGAPADATPH